MDGYLGIAALGRLVTSVDYGTQTLTLIRQRNSYIDLGTLINSVGRSGNVQSPESRPGFNFPVRTTASGFLSGEILIDGVKKPLNFIIDTGATVTVMAEKLAVQDEVQPFIKEGRMRVFGAAGIAEDVKMALLPKISVGGYSREKVDAAVLDLEPVNETAGFLQSGILGGNFLRHFRVVFDFQRGVVRLEPLEASAVQIGSPTPENSVH